MLLWQPDFCTPPRYGNAVKVWNFASDYLLLSFKGAQYLLIIHEVLVAMGFFPAGVQDETLNIMILTEHLFSVSIQ